MSADDRSPDHDTSTPTPPDSDTGHEQGRGAAIIKTTLIVVGVVGVCFLLAWLITRRLIDSWSP